ncbi:hypothetical protein G7046_g2676 [Stylonectria norvegica]|nr:hypothetical protein G7046_g2676 [Stylonectria norvegica]
MDPSFTDVSTIDSYEWLPGGWWMDDMLRAVNARVDSQQPTAWTPRTRSVVRYPLSVRCFHPQQQGDNKMERKCTWTGSIRAESGRTAAAAADAVGWMRTCNYFSAFLAGMKRSTGLTPSFKTDKASGENKDVSKWIDKYLGVGEWVMDQSVAIAGSSGFFERTR